MRRSLYAVSAMLLASGVAWLAAERLRVLDGNGLGTLAMRLHGAAAMVMLLLIGGVAALHVPPAWRQRKNLASGASMTATLGVLTLTGYLLYYLGDDSARNVTSVVHWLAGLLAPLLGVWHVASGRARANSRHSNRLSSRARRKP